jgi:hypothetical protein
VLLYAGLDMVKLVVGVGAVVSGMRAQVRYLDDLQPEQFFLLH